MYQQSHGNTVNNHGELLAGLPASMLRLVPHISLVQIVMFTAALTCSAINLIVIITVEE
jgi:hypothetical protein